ncbi:class I SAM-dependent methyltransferase [Brevibacterium sp. HMSC24B04]|uniref:class I SAM-dependent methyltransferase n=1 Tax=Brevibacterium sp. HMSC24B04 TaxID=1581060 RepID=UPI0008A591EE|nr:class I SAM-dependent methyltransferase [Brevibacterium sp. HMSC24B04]OFT95021.1 methyltransferase type 11 [Brevibacterium sp. HMSC24B04]
MAGPKIRREAKERGTLFGASADEYERIRPGYPDAAVRAVAERASTAAADEAGGEVPADPAGIRVLDVGSGTGKYGRAFAELGFDVHAVDPDSALLEINPLPSAIARAEELPFADASFDLVVSAQAWHWFDAEAASAEFARVLKPGGVAAIVLNQLDVRVDWVLRLSRIMHAGDVYRPQWRPELGAGFGTVEARIDEFSVPMTIDDTVALTATRTYWLRSNDTVRARVEGNLRGYLTEEHPVSEPFDLPYMCLTYMAQKQ